MRKLRILATTMVGLWCCLVVSAYDFRANGIYFNKIDEFSVEVTFGSYDEDEGYSSSTGDVVVPPSVTYNGKTYTVTAIGDHAFEDGWEIKSITLPNTITRIGDYAFCNVYYITEITIPAGVTSIGKMAFLNCSGLTSFTIKATTSPTLGNSAFQYIPKSCVLNYPKGCYDSYASWSAYFKMSITDFSAEGIYYNVLSNSAQTVEVTFRGEKYNSFADEYTGDVVIPETVTCDGKTYTVTAIGLSAFSGCENVTSVQLPSTITVLEEYAFNYCTKLSSINLPEGLTTIGPRALRICHALTSIEIPESVTKIDEHAFYECLNLRSIAFKGAVQSIAANAFSECNSLVEAHVDDIADWCQMGFEGVKANPLAVNLTYRAEYGNVIGNRGALYVNGEKVTELVIPDNVVAINDYAFYACEEIASVNFGTGVKTIGKEAFACAYGLTNLIIPSNVVLIEDDAFSACQEVQQITIEDSEEALTLGCIPNDNPNYEPYGLFSTCRLSKPLYIGRNIKYSYDANVGPFELANGYYEQMGTVTFGELVTEIPPYLLNRYTYITDVYFKFKSNPKIGESAFAPEQVIHLALNDAENVDFNAENENTFASAEYYRELGEGKFGTIMLPFAPKSDNYVFFKLTATNGDMLTFDEELEPKANTPYLYRVRENAENGAIISEGSITVKADIVNTNLNDWQMVGSFINQTITTENADAYYYAYTSADNMLHRVTKKLNVKPYRAYFTANGGQPAQLAIRTRGGDITIIDAAEVEDLAPVVYYDLSGRRIDNPTKGVYIVNGKKVIL